MDGVRVVRRVTGALSLSRTTANPKREKATTAHPMHTTHRLATTLSALVLPRPMSAIDILRQMSPIYTPTVSLSLTLLSLSLFMCLCVLPH